MTGRAAVVEPPTPDALRTGSAPITVLRNGAMVDVVAVPTELS